MDLIADLRRTVDAYCRATGLSPSRVATLAVNDGKLFARIGGGGSLTVATYERLMAWFADRWPAETPWPEGVARPAPESEAA